MLYLLGCILMGAAGLMLLSLTMVVPIPMKIVTLPATVLCFYYCGKYAKTVLIDMKGGDDASN